MGFGLLVLNKLSCLAFKAVLQIVPPSARQVAANHCDGGGGGVRHRGHRHRPAGEPGVRGRHGALRHLLLHHLHQPRQGEGPRSW